MSVRLNIAVGRGRRGRRHAREAGSRSFIIEADRGDINLDEVDEEAEDVLAKALDDVNFIYGKWNGNIREVGGLWRWYASSDEGELGDREGGDLRDVFGVADFIKRNIRDFEAHKPIHSGVQVSDFRE